MTFARVSDAPNEQVGGEALLDQVVLRAAVDGLDREILVVERPEDDDGRGPAQLPDDGEAISALDRRPRQTQQHDVVRVRAELRHRRTRLRRRHDGE